jgi:hypothetical protein
MSLRDQIRRLKQAAETDIQIAVCVECGEEQRIRRGIMFDLVALKWQMGKDGGDSRSVPDDTPADVRWVFEHPHAALSLVDKYTLEPITGHNFSEVTRRMQEGAENGA